ncbi:MAG: NAD-dependent epimerase/dehydratase family protein [Vulcanimicrobiaceae bacterium]
MAPDRVFLTGATGFVGSYVLRELVAAGYRVRALVRNAEAPLGDCEIVTGDLTRPGELARALDGCRYLIHCAALYSFTPRDRAAIHHVNVDGTVGLMTAAHIAGVERAVLTSSSATVGHEHDGKPATEADYPADARRQAHVDKSDYHHSKLLQERAAFAGRVPLVAVLPTAPVGPGDRKPTPTGKMILDFARGKMFAKPPAGGGMNLVAVEDVARAHVTALERGRVGERYLIGGENLTFDAIWELLASISGRDVPRFRAPLALALGVAYVDELRCRLQTYARPLAPLEGVRMSVERMYVDCAKARRELGYEPQPVRPALERAVSWYRMHGYLA